jgi:signal transduction histidine kinase
MGGEIEIESKVGKGTNVWITIPAKRCDDDKKIIVD